MSPRLCTQDQTGFLQGHTWKATLYLQAPTDSRLTVSSHKQKNTLETGKSTKTRGSNISQFSPLQSLHAHLWSNTNEPWPAQLPTYETAMGMQRSETSIPVPLPAPAALLLFLPVLAGWSWLLPQPHLQSAVQTSPETLQVPQYLSWAKKHTCNYSPTQVKNIIST